MSFLYLCVRNGQKYQDNLHKFDQFNYSRYRVAYNPHDNVQSDKYHYYNQETYTYPVNCGC